MANLKALNLSLSSACKAKCYFCPLDRGRRIPTKVMPLEHAKRIIDEAAAMGVKRYRFSENGDGLIHRNFLEILRHVKLRRPDAEFHLHTNMQHLDPPLADAMLSEDLVHLITVNIDGGTKESYEAIKKIPYETVINNLVYFFKKRNEINAHTAIVLFCIPIRHYVNYIQNTLGVWPIQVSYEQFNAAPDPNTDYAKVVTMFESYVNREAGDAIWMSIPFGWAERDSFKNAQLDYSKQWCPLLYQVENEAYIAPDGSWYICCYDSNNENILGNVIQTSLAEVANGERRAQLIQMLKDRKFAEIGGPCKTVNCCNMNNPAPSEYPNV